MRRPGHLAAVVLALIGCACTSLRGPTPEKATADPVPTCTPASLEARAGRVLLVGLPRITAPQARLVTEVLEVGVGGVLLTDENVESSSQVHQLVQAIRQRARHPILVLADEEPGRVRTFADVLGPVPSARRLANERTVDEVQQLARTNGLSLARLGVNLNLAPVADLDDGPWNGIIGDRSFSEDPREAGAYALAYARGLQQAGVTPAIKHFPGHGRTDEDDHVELPRVDDPLPVLRATDVRPFEQAVAAGVPVVMVGHVAYRALDYSLPASLSPAAYRLLREIGFRGVAITDSIGMGAVNLRWDFDVAAVKAVAAGADGILATDGSQARRMRDAVVRAVRSGVLPEERLNEAAGRMAALARGDAYALTCEDVALPVLR